MNRPNIETHRRAALVLPGAVLFNHSRPALVDRSALAAGVPVLYEYVFVAWALLVGLLVLAVERT